MYSDSCNAATLDYVSKLALGVRYGIMWVLNGSGLGTAYHAAESMHEYLAHTDVGFPAVPVQLKTQFESGKSWDIIAFLVLHPRPLLPWLFLGLVRGIPKKPHYKDNKGTI
jgi:hypothetical protein